MRIEWDESYSVKIGDIDDQHKELINLFNEVHDCIDSNRAIERLGSVLEDLIDYTRVHFVTEEKLLRENGYPNYEQHKKMHDDLTIRVLDLQDRYSKDHSVAVLIDSMKFMTDWLTQHIIRTDKQYSTYLSNRGVK